MEEGSTAVIIIASRSITNKTGHMVEEWQLSAHNTAKHIMQEQFAWEDNFFESNLHSLLGRNRTVTTIVVSARKSVCIVIYTMPDSDDMRRSVFWPSILRKCSNDLSNRSKEICAEFLQCRENDLEEHYSAALTPIIRNQLKQYMSKHLPPNKESELSKATNHDGKPKRKDWVYSRHCE